jgi:hypothetical protein
MLHSLEQICSLDAALLTALWPQPRNQHLYNARRGERTRWLNYHYIFDSYFRNLRSNLSHQTMPPNSKSKLTLSSKNGIVHNHTRGAFFLKELSEQTRCHAMKGFAFHDLVL